MEKNVKQVFSKIGFIFLFFYILSTVLPGLSDFITTNIDLLELLNEFWFYIVPLPIIYFLLRKIEKTDIPKKSITIKSFLIIIAILFTAMVIGNSISLGLTGLLGKFITVGEVEGITVITQKPSFLVLFITTVVMPPIFEEIFFRKFLIDRTIKYGIPLSVIFSALLFGLYHENLYQFFYAFLLGIVLGLVYCKTGKIGYTMLLHGIFNFWGGIIPEFIDGAFILGIDMANVYTGIEVILAIIGIIVLIKYRSKFRGLKNKLQTINRQAFLNLGVICLIIYEILMTIMYTVL